MGIPKNLQQLGRYSLEIDGEHVGTFDSIGPLDPDAEYVEGPGAAMFTRKFQPNYQDGDLQDGDMEVVGWADWIEGLPEESWVTTKRRPVRATVRIGAPQDVALLVQAQLEMFGVEHNGTYSTDCVAKVVAFLGSLGFYPQDGHLERVDPETLERYGLEMARDERGE